MKLVSRARLGGALLLAVVLFPVHASAHSAGPHLAQWADGFSHPLQGWDHLLAMVAVGLWAAQQRGSAVWLLPAAFLGAMAAGGGLGASGLPLAGVEAMIVLSVPVFGLLVLRRARFGPPGGAALVALFAFFHGFAHGQEMPGGAGIAGYGAGFLLATALLHGLGIAVVRIALLLGAALAAAPALAQQQVAAEGPRMSEIVVYGRQNSLLGIAGSASQGTVGIDQLERRPLLRTGEVLETVPGMIVTQHAGGGKANQYFLRGFNLDHGTDFASSLDGMPVNMPSHGHGQGYTDMNILIPELAERVNYRKGMYDARQGDFSSAGSVDIASALRLPRDLVSVEGGMYGAFRSVAAASRDAGPGTALGALELVHNDGPWDRPDNFRKVNGQLSWSQGDADEGFSVIARGYRGLWNSSDQVAASAVADGLVPFYGSLDDSTGGRSQRYSLQAEWHRSDADSATRVMAYGLRYTMGLFSNFSYFLIDPVRGDQFEQVDRRWTGGVQASHTLYGDWAGRSVETTAGVQFRHDGIRNGLFNTWRTQRTDKEMEDGTVLPATVRSDRISQQGVGLYLQNRIRWTDWLRTEAGLRGDFYRFDVRSDRPENSGAGAAGLPSPKLGMVLGPWAKTEFYLQGGLGFHSNDARGATTRVDPVTGDPVDPADPLVRTRGAEVGLRTLALDGLQSTLSLWWLDVDSELLFVGDAGSTEASRPSRRYGIELANYYTPADWLTLDADLSLSRTRFRDRAPEGRHIPGSIETVLSAGVTVHDPGGPFGSLRLRYFGPRPLIEDDSVRSRATIMLNARVGYRLSETWTVSADVFNLLGRRDHDIDYFYQSRVRPGADPAEENHFHPVEPRQVRVTLTARF